MSTSFVIIRIRIFCDNFQIREDILYIFRRYDGWEKHAEAVFGFKKVKLSLFYIFGQVRL